MFFKLKKEIVYTLALYRIADLFAFDWKKHTPEVGSFRCAQWECLARKRANVGRKYQSGWVPRGIRIRESLQRQTAKSLAELSASSSAVREFFCDIKRQRSTCESTIFATRRKKVLKNY